MRHRPLLFIVLAFASGIFLDGLLVPSLPLLLCPVLGALVACWALVFLLGEGGTGHLYRGTVYMSCCLFLSLLSGAVYHHIRFYSFSDADIGRLVSEERVLMRLRGVVIEPSFTQTVDSSILPWKGAREDTKRCQFLLGVKAVEGRYGWHRAGGVVQVRVYNPLDTTFRYGQVVEFLGKVYAPPGARNPGQMDYRGYLQGKMPAIRAVASVEEGQNVKILASGQGNAFFRTVYLLKERLEAGIARSALPGSAATMAGLVWGEREEMPREVLDEFRKTGTYHFLAISGTQVGMIVITIHFFLFLLRIPRRHIAPIVMAVAMLYALLTGFEPPVLRAALLAVFCYGSLLVKREWDLPSGISTAVLATLLFNPADLFNPGFQLSLAGFLGLVYLEARIESLFWGSSLLVERLRVPEERRRFRTVWVYLRKALCGSIGAWAAISPLALYYFHLFSPWGAILTLLLFPLVWILTISGFCLSILGQLSVTAAFPIAHLAEAVDILMKGIISGVASVPFTYVYGPSPSWPWLMVFYISGALALVMKGIGVRLSYVAGALLLAGNVYVYSEIPLWGRDSMKVVVLDVGHGSCVFVRFPNGRTMLYDAGTRGYFDVGRHVVAPFLWQEGVKEIDLVVVSHEDADHFNALPFLAERFRMGRVLVNDHLLSSEEGRPLVDFIKSMGMTVEVIQEGVRLNGLGGAGVEVLNPPQDNSMFSANDASCVLRVDYQGRSVLLCGDIEGQAIGRLIAFGAEIGAEIVVAPHHGSYSPNLDKFLERVSPEYVAVSTERKKLDYYYSRTSPLGKVLPTSELGAISFTIKGGDIGFDGYLPGAPEVKRGRTTKRAGVKPAPTPGAPGVKRGTDD